MKIITGYIFSFISSSIVTGIILSINNPYMLMTIINKNTLARTVPRCCAFLKNKIVSNLELFKKYQTSVECISCDGNFLRESK